MTTEEVEIQKLKDAADLNLQQHKEIMEAIKAINNKLSPISDTYRTVNTLGKWLMAVLVFLSILVGVIASYFSIFNRGK